MRNTTAELPQKIHPLTMAKLNQADSMFRQGDHFGALNLFHHLLAMHIDLCPPTPLNRIVYCYIFLRQKNCHVSLNESDNVYMMTSIFKNTVINIDYIYETLISLNAGEHEDLKQGVILYAIYLFSELKEKWLPRILHDICHRSIEQQGEGFTFLAHEIKDFIEFIGSKKVVMQIQPNRSTSSQSQSAIVQPLEIYSLYKIIGINLYESSKLSGSVSQLYDAEHYLELAYTHPLIFADPDHEQTIVSLILVYIRLTVCLQSEGLLFYTSHKILNVVNGVLSDPAIDHNMKVTLKFYAFKAYTHLKLNNEAHESLQFLRNNVHLITEPDLKQLVEAEILSYNRPVNYTQHNIARLRVFSSSPESPESGSQHSYQG